MEHVQSLKTLFEDPPELYLIKGGKWNQVQNYLNIFLFLSASILLVKQESDPVIVCYSYVGNESASLGSNYAFMEEECEGQAVDTWFREIFHMYLGWFFTVQVIAIIIWGRMWIGGNRILLEMCSTFGRIADAITVCEDENNKHCINQNYLQRANKVFFHGLRTSHNIFYSKIWWVSGASVFTLIFSVINFGILRVTRAYHQESINCHYNSNLSVTCQFTSFDFVFVLASIYNAILLLEFFCLFLEGVGWIRFKSDLIEDIYTKFEYPLLSNMKYLDKKEAKLEAEKSVEIVELIPPELIKFQCSLQAQERCDLCFLMKSLEMIHGKAMGFLFLSIMDEKVKLGWALTENKKSKKNGVLKLSKIYHSFYSQNVGNLKLISPNAPQILYTTDPESDDWEMVAGLTTRWLEWSDWENDTIEILVDNEKEVTTRITWNKRVILEDTFQSDSSKNMTDK